MIKFEETEERLESAQPRRGSRLLAVTSFLFIVLQAACAWVMAVSGVRLAIGLGALAAASGSSLPATGYHADAIRIPMMALAVVGSLVNLYILWRIRSLRVRPSAQWRTRALSGPERRSEMAQSVLAVLALALVVAEWFSHRIVHHTP